MWWCNSCKIRFTFDDGFWKMKHKPVIIAEACSCYRRGMSFKSVSRHFKEYDKARICPATVYNWVIKYTKITKEFTDKLIPKIRGRIHEDEVIVKVRKKKSLSLAG
jgi:transposase-like protein